MSAPTGPATAQAVPATAGAANPETASAGKMLALAWYGKNDVRVVEVDKPKPAGWEDVVVKVRFSR